MALMALRFMNAGRGEKPLRTDLEAGTTDVCAKLKMSPGLAVLVVRNLDLERLRQFEDLIVDRGRKHPAKPLSELLLGHDRIPMIEGSYRDPGQLRRSLRTLLKNARSRGEANLYIVGTEECVLEELWREAPPESAPVDRATTGPVGLSELLAELPVPPELEEVFTGQTKEYALVRQLILRAANVDDAVLLLGDTGTGKSLVARLIHQNSRRRSHPFVEVNCSAIPLHLFESELFGHMKGAFTGATRNKLGLWQIAGEGTLLLDEIGDLRPEHQGKILHALHEKKIRRVGGEEDIEVKARVIAATNRDLLSMVQRGEFRADLFFRLCQFVIPTPTLEADPDSFAHIVHKAWEKITGDPDRRLPDSLVAELSSRRWPGNVRELKWTLIRLRALFGTDVRVEHLRALFEFYDQAMAGRQESGASQDISRFRIECLSHLRRADAVVHACELALRPLKEETWTARTSLEPLRTSLGYLSREMDNLCRDRLLFHSEAVYLAVVRLREKLGYLQRLLEDGGQDLWRYWKMELAPELERSVSLIFQEVRQVVAEV